MLGDTSYASQLRNLIAKCVSGDPQTYNPVFLGGSNLDYCNWILDKEHWGGMFDAPCPFVVIYAFVSSIATYSPTDCWQCGFPLRVVSELISKGCFSATEWELEVSSFAI